MTRLGSGMAAALELARQEEPEGEDADLFGDDELVPMPLPAAVKRSGPGRPKGRRNRSTEQWKAHLLSRYHSPLEGVCEIYQRDREDLARELRLFVYGEDGEPLFGRDGRERLAPGALVTAFRLQLEAYQTALPYLHQRQPLAIETKGEGNVAMILMGSFEGADASDGLVFASEQNQGLIECDAVRLTDAKSDDGDKA